jgi:hypothetical protein
MKHDHASSPCHPSLLTLASLLCTGGAAAQQMWIVDALNRPGTNFTDIQSAVDAAAPGDVVKVRDARPTVPSYAGASLVRGISLLGEPRALLQSALRISGIPADQRCNVAALDVDTSFGQNVVVSNCAGQVHFEAVHAALQVFLGTISGFAIENSAHVTLTRCVALGLSAVTCSGSGVTVTDSTLLGQGYYESLGGPGLVANASRVTLAGTTVRGASTNSCCVALRPPQPGIAGTLATLFLTGSRTTITGGGVLATPCACNTPEVGVVADPGTRLLVGNAQPFTWRGPSPLPLPLPWLSPTRNAGQSTISWRLEGPANAAFATLLGLPGGPIIYPFGDVWLDLAKPHLVLDSGVLSGSAHVHQRTIPGPLPVGLAVACQSALLDAGTVRLSTAAVTVLY